MQMNIPATFGPICFSGSLEEDWNVYGQMTDDKRWAKKIDKYYIYHDSYKLTYLNKRIRKMSLFQQVHK